MRREIGTSMMVTVKGRCPVPPTVDEYGVGFACWPRPTDEEVAALAAVLLTTPEPSAEPPRLQTSLSRWALAGRRDAHQGLFPRPADGVGWKRRDRHG